MINDQLERGHVEKVQYALLLEEVTGPSAQSVVLAARCSLVATAGEAKDHDEAVVARHSEWSDVQLASGCLFPCPKPKVGVYLINRIFSAHNTSISQAILARNLSR